MKYLKKIYGILKKKSEKTFIKPFIRKFCNLYIKKGFKNKSIKFFYSLFREHKRKLLSYFNWKYQNKLKFLKNKKIIIQLKKSKSLKKLFKSLKFINMLRWVSNLITFKFELKSGRFKAKKMKKEKLIPQFITPWRGFRLGLNLLIKNSKVRPTFVKNKKKTYLYKLLTEIWETYHQYSPTFQHVLEFIDTVFNYSENSRLVKYHSLKKFKNKIRIMSKSKIKNPHPPILPSFRNYKSRPILIIKKRKNKSPLLKFYTSKNLYPKFRRIFRYRHKKRQILKGLKRRIKYERNFLKNKFFFRRVEFKVFKTKKPKKFRKLKYNQTKKFIILKNKDYRKIKYFNLLLKDDIYKKKCFEYFFPKIKNKKALSKSQKKLIQTKKKYEKRHFSLIFSKKIKELKKLRRLSKLKEKNMMKKLIYIKKSFNFKTFLNVKQYRESRKLFPKEKRYERKKFFTLNSNSNRNHNFSLNLKKLKKNDLKKYFIVQARLEKKLTGKGKVKNRILKRIKALTKAEIKILTKAKAKILSLVKAKDKILNNKIEIKKRKKKEEKAMPNQIKIKMAKKKKVDYINISFIKKFIKDKKSKKKKKKIYQSS